MLPNFVNLANFNPDFNSLLSSALFPQAAGKAGEKAGPELLRRVLTGDAAPRGPTDEPSSTPDSSGDAVETETSDAEDELPSDSIADELSSGDLSRSISVRLIVHSDPYTQV